jgi:hypothetical protein
MASVNYHGLMELSIQVNSLMTDSTVKANIDTMMEGSTSVAGTMESNTVMVKSYKEVK